MRDLNLCIVYAKMHLTHPSKFLMGFQTEQPWTRPTLTSCNIVPNLLVGANRSAHDLWQDLRHEKQYMHITFSICELSWDERNAITILISLILQECSSAQTQLSEYIYLRFLLETAFATIDPNVFIHLSLLLESIMKYDPAIETVTSHNDLLLTIAEGAAKTSHGVEYQMFFSRLMQSIATRCHVFFLDAALIDCFLTFCRCLHAPLLEDTNAYVMHCLQQQTLLSLLSNTSLVGFQTLYLSKVKNLFRHMKLLDIAQQGCLLYNPTLAIISIFVLSSNRHACIRRVLWRNSARLHGLLGMVDDDHALNRESRIKALLVVEKLLTEPI